tara:strand:- start:22877 stop:23152 length:276 start_codon:yes stop_codon:yes gene_type:complete
MNSNGLQLTDAQIHSSMINGYYYLIKKETYPEAIHRNKCEKVFYPFPVDEITIGDIKTLIEYFASPKIEEYEKCTELQNLINIMRKHKLRS